jgi:hypothetical protein
MSIAAETHLEEEAPLNNDNNKSERPSYIPDIEYDINGNEIIYIYWTIQTKNTMKRLISALQQKRENVTSMLCDANSAIQHILRATD